LPPSCPRRAKPNKSGATIARLVVSGHHVAKNHPPPQPRIGQPVRPVVNGTMPRDASEAIHRGRVARIHGVKVHVVRIRDGRLRVVMSHHGRSMKNARARPPFLNQNLNASQHHHPVWV
jgi:hypothetical protein